MNDLNKKNSIKIGVFKFVRNESMNQTKRFLLSK